MKAGLLQADLFETPARLPEGVTLFRGLAAPNDRDLLDAMSSVLEAAPPYHLRMKTGATMINRMTNCGAYGWHSDARGYRYVDRHPETDLAWPPIPPSVAALAIAAARRCGIADFEPDACLVNLYQATGRLSLHQDHDEADFRWPIVSFSFGQDAAFVLGGARRHDPVQTMRLTHGDVLVLHGPGRMRFHGVKAILPGPTPCAHPAIPPGGRLNLTLRRAR